MLWIFIYMFNFILVILKSLWCIILDEVALRYLFLYLLRLDCLVGVIWIIYHWLRYFCVMLLPFVVRLVTNIVCGSCCSVLTLMVNLVNLINVFLFKGIVIIPILLLLVEEWVLKWLFCRLLQFNLIIGLIYIILNWFIRVIGYYIYNMLKSIYIVEYILNSILHSYITSLCDCVVGCNKKEIFLQNMSYFLFYELYIVLYNNLIYNIYICKVMFDMLVGGYLKFIRIFKFIIYISRFIVSFIVHNIVESIVKFVKK